MLRRAKVGAVIMAIATALAVLPAATASARVEKSAACKAYTTEVAKEQKSSTALGKDIARGSWTKVKAALLSTFNDEANAEKQFTVHLKGASPKVKAAIAVALKLNDSFTTVIQNATSLAQFEAGITAVQSTPKVKAALRLLNSYTAHLC